MNHLAAALRLDCMKLLHGVIPLLLLLRTEPLKTFDPVEHADALLGAHAVEVIQLVELALLGRGVEFSEAGLILQGAVLLGGREILVVLDPLFEVAFTLRNCGGARLGRAVERPFLLNPHLGAGFCTLDSSRLRSEPVGERTPGKQENDTCVE
jgi:hypothetical protein